MQLDGPSKLLLHFVPASALVGSQATGLWPVPSEVRNLLRPSSLSSSTGWRYNADGFLVFSLKGEQNCASYIQLFRNGCLEYGDGYILNVGNERGRPGAIPSKAFEEKLVGTFANALLVLNRLGVEDPVYFSCTLLGVKNSTLSREGLAFYGDEIQHTFDRQIIQTPEVEIDRTEVRPYPKSALAVINIVWQASGYESTPW